MFVGERLGRLVIGDLGAGCFREKGKNVRGKNVGKHMSMLSLPRAVGPPYSQCQHSGVLEILGFDVTFGLETLTNDEVPNPSSLHYSQVRGFRCGKGKISRANGKFRFNGRAANQFASPEEKFSRRQVYGNSINLSIGGLSGSVNMPEKSVVCIPYLVFEGNAGIDDVSLGVQGGDLEDQVASTDVGRLCLQRKFFNGSGEERVYLARRRAQVGIKFHFAVGQGLHLHPLHFQHVVANGRTSGKTKNRPRGSLVHGLVVAGEFCRSVIGHDEILALSAAQPIGTDQHVVLRRRRNLLLDHEFANQLLGLDRKVPPTLVVEIEVLGKRTAETVVNLVQV